jgi:hypothetical protein
MRFSNVVSPPATSTRRIHGALSSKSTLRALSLSCSLHPSLNGHSSYLQQLTMLSDLPFSLQGTENTDLSGALAELSFRTNMPH